jgi:uncharacterized protein YecT (DUF1311 family)
MHTRLLLVAILLTFSGLPVVAHAIDNPDAPDRVVAFQRRAAPFEKRLTDTDGGSASVRAGKTYSDFLEMELNSAYLELLAKLQGPARAALIESQRKWLRFRDSEDLFIAQHWTNERNGSSATLSVASYRSGIVRDRILQLLRYTAEYP